MIINVILSKAKNLIPKLPAVYIVTNRRNGVLYTGVTSNLIQRCYQHRNGLLEGFSKKYKCKVLVYFERYETMEEAILREKQIKGYLRSKKIALIESLNSEWQDLYESLL